MKLAMLDFRIQFRFCFVFMVMIGCVSILSVQAKEVRHRLNQLIPTVIR